MSTSYSSAEPEPAPQLPILTATTESPRAPAIARGTRGTEENKVSAAAAIFSPNTTEVDGSSSAPPPVAETHTLTGDAGPLNRVQLVREQQGVTARTIARRLGIDLRSYRRLEDPSSNLTTKELHALQKALEVPLADLIVERTSLARPVEERAKMIKIMKTAVAMREGDLGKRSQRMAEMLCNQLIDLMPELADVSGWPQFGARRGVSAIGKALQQQIDVSNIPSD